MADKQYQLGPQVPLGGGKKKLGRTCLINGNTEKATTFYRECKSNTQGTGYISNINLAVWDTVESSHVGRLGNEPRDRAGEYVD